MLSLSRIPWGGKCKKTSSFPASLCQQLLTTNWTYGFHGFVLEPTQGGEQGKNVREIIDCHRKYFQMSVFKRESESRELTFTSGFVGGYHLPQMLVNPQLYFFACSVVFTFHPSPTVPEVVARAAHFFNSTCISHTPASPMRVFWLGSGWDKERLLVWLDPRLAPQCESGL